MISEKALNMYCDVIKQAFRVAYLVFVLTELKKCPLFTLAFSYSKYIEWHANKYLSILLKQFEMPLLK